MQDLNPLGAAGNATVATAAKGFAVIKDAGLQLASLLAEVARLPLDTVGESTAWQEPK
jgi:creatinine amidohydrolase